MPNGSSNNSKDGQPTLQDTLSGAGSNNKKGKEEGVDRLREAAGEGMSNLSEVGNQAKTAASSVAAAASEKAQRVVSETSDEFEHMFNERKQEGAEQMHRLASAVERASSELQEEFPLVARYVKRGASKVDRFADTIKERDGRTLAAEAGDLVRRHTGAMAGVLGLVGFAAVRFFKAQPPRSGGASGQSQVHGRGRGTSEPVQRALARSAAPGKGTGSGDPGGTSPVAPGFETTSNKGVATRGIS